MRSKLFNLALAVAVAVTPAAAYAGDSALSHKVGVIIQRPIFRHATFGMEFYDLDTKRPIYEYNSDRFFAPASTTKLITEGTLLEQLGPDFRFHTRVYASVPITSGGTLNGNIIVIPSGDPNLSNRIQPDGSLAFENEDHVYDGQAVPGDPLAVIRELARSIANKVKTLNGRVLIDQTLFPEGEHESGTGTVVSPMVVNDNVIDVTVRPGAKQGEPATISVSPQTRYATFINQVTTSPADTAMSVAFQDTDGPGGTRVVNVSGTVPVGAQPALNAYAVPSPILFAQVALSQALTDAGVTIHTPPGTSASVPAGLNYSQADLLAEHISPPLSEEVKVTLKVSQNLHAHLAPYLLGVYKAHASEDVEQAGFDVERHYLQSAGLNTGAASIADGEGTAFLTPRFVVAYLAYMRTRPLFPIFERALPILGLDGTLWNIQTHSPAAGRVHAKTGTDEQPDLLNRGIMVSAKGLAGYVTSRHGRHIAFAVYVNNLNLKNDADVDAIAGQTMGELAALAYDL